MEQIKGALDAAKQTMLGASAEQVGQPLGNTGGITGCCSAGGGGRSRAPPAHSPTAAACLNSHHPLGPIQQPPAGGKPLASGTADKPAMHETGAKDQTGPGVVGSMEEAGHRMMASGWVWRK